MIIDLLPQLEWTPYGVRCTDIRTTKAVHKFFREAILDRHIYITKPIGFTIATNNAFRAYSGNYIARHKQIGESYPEVMVNMFDKVFVNESEQVVKTILHTGDNLLPETKFGDLRNHTSHVLFTNPKICRCLKKETIFKVKLEYSHGYRDMQRNSTDLSPEYFPCITDFSLAEYIRVLPIPKDGDKTLVPMKFYNGCTMEDFQEIINKWVITIKSGNVDEEELIWLQQSFVR